MRSSRSPWRALRARLKRPALLAVLALAGAGLVMPVATAPAASAAPVCEAGDLWNPMGAATPIGSADGYSVFVTGDALLANQELEGSIAVAGTLTFGSMEGNGSAQYPIVHKIAGNADYALPVIDGAPNRVLAQRYAPGTRDVVVQVKDQGATTPAQKGGAKLFDRTSPSGYQFREAFEAGGTTFWPTGGSNQSPQFSSWVQSWAGGDGADTFVPAKPQFADYFEADAGTALLAQTGIWYAPLNFPTGGDVTVTLDPAGPNRVELSDFAGVQKFSLVNQSATAPLIVKVNPGDVVGGVITVPSISQAGNAGDMASYVLFDLSEITGAVTVKTPNEPIRGAIYAPQAHIVVPNDANGGKELEGQVIAQHFSDYASKEIHTNLFKGVLPCVPTSEAPAELSLFKTLLNPDGVSGAPSSFEVSFWIDGVAQAPLVLDANGTVVGPIEVSAGARVELGEIVPSDVPGAEWTSVGEWQLSGAAAIEPTEPGAQVAFLATEGASVTAEVTNALAAETPEVGGFSLAKALDGLTSGDFPADASFVVEYFLDGSSSAAGTVTVRADGTVVDGPQDLPVGTVVTFGEVTPTTTPAGFVWEGATFAPSSVEIADGQNVAVTVTNAYRDAVGGFSVKKALFGIDASVLPDGPDAQFTIEYSTDGGDTWDTVTVKADGVPVAVEGLPLGSIVEFREVSPPAAPGYEWTGAVFEPSSVTITEDGQSTAVTVTNTYEAVVAPVGGFSLAKVLDGVSVGDFPSDASFEVEYFLDGSSAPAGTVSVGADGTVVDGPQDLALGTVVTFGEVVPTNTPAGYEWAGAVFEPSSVTITEDGQNSAVTVTNTYEAVVAPVGGFSLAKVLDGVSVGDFPSDASFEVEYFLDGSSAPAGTVSVGADGTVVDGPQDLELGTVVTFGEVVPTNTPAGYEWAGAVFEPSSVTITEDGQNSAVTVTNTYEAVVAPVGGFSLAKVLDGVSVGDFPSDASFEVEYFLDGSSAPAGTVSVDADGTVVDGPQDLELGTVVTFGEVVPTNTPADLVWTGATFEPSSVEISDGEQNTLVTVTNSYRNAIGGFSLTKALSGTGQDLVPADAVFTVDYFLDGAADAAGSVELSVDGTPVVVDGLTPGTVVTFAETARPDVPGATWGAATFSPESVTVAEGVVATVVLTNEITEDEESEDPEDGDETEDPDDGDETEDPDDGDETEDPDDGDETEVPDDGTKDPDDGDEDGVDDGRDDEDEELATTGAQIGSLVAIAALLLGAGMTFVLVSRRRV